MRVEQKISAENLPFTLLPNEVALLLRRSYDSVLADIKKGEIPARKIGREYRINRDMFLAWYKGDPESDHAPKYRVIGFEPPRPKRRGSLVRGE